MKENQNDMNAIDGVRLSPHFLLREFLNLNKYPENFPTMQVVANLTYGCHQLLEPAKLLPRSRLPRSVVVKARLRRRLKRQLLQLQQQRLLLRRVMPTT